MLGVGDEVEPLAVDDQQRRVLVLVEVAAVGVGEPGEVVRRDRPLVLDPALVHAVDQRLDRRLQVDHEVRRRRLGLQVRVHLLVEPELGVGQVEPGEQRVLVEQEVADGRAAEHVELADAAQLVDALEQEVELRGQRVARHVLVEAREERVVLGALEQRVAGQARGELPREARLARADRPLDDDVAALLEIHASGRLVDCGWVRVRRCAGRARRRGSAAQPAPGNRRRRADRSTSGRSTKARSCIRGCGTVRPGSRMRTAAV